MKNILNKNLQSLQENKVDWGTVQLKMKEKFGTDIYESWLRKIEFIEEFNNYILLKTKIQLKKLLDTLSFFLLNKKLIMRLKLQ